LEAKDTNLVTPKLLAKYEEMQASENDTSEFITLFQSYAAQCRHAISTVGFLAGLPEQLHSYDINYSENIKEVEDLADQNGVFFYFHLNDVLEVDIAETDLLFIDTYHSYKQLKAELTRHGNKARKWILLHDTTLFGEEGMDSPIVGKEGMESLRLSEKGMDFIPRGLNHAIHEFLRANTKWRLKEKIESPWGLTILEKINV
jgi:hypothetical protein